MYPNFHLIAIFIPVLIGVGIGLALYGIASWIISTKPKEFNAKDYCHVKFDSGIMGTTVTCEGVCGPGGTCNLYSRKKGTENKWKSTEKDQVDDTTMEYRCFCHNPNA